MSIQWYYSHAGITRGPFPEEEINGLVARNAMLASDLVWPESKDRQDAVPAVAIFDFAPSSAVRSPLPDWLADVAATESKGPAPGPGPSHEMPEWLEERLEHLRLWLGLDLKAPPTPTAESALSKSGSAEAAPDWRQGLPPQEKPPLPPTIRNAVAPQRVTPPAANVSSPPKITPPPQKPIDPLIEKLRQTSGFDLATGQIIDPVKFQKWIQQQAPSSSVGQTAVSKAPLLEVFRKVRVAIDAWVDDPVNRACIMQTDIEEIKRRPAIQAIHREYANYDHDLQEKILRYLEVTVELRKKSYQADNARSN